MLLSHAVLEYIYWVICLFRNSGAYSLNLFNSCTVHALLLRYQIDAEIPYSWQPTSKKNFICIFVKQAVSYVGKSYLQSIQFEAKNCQNILQKKL